MCKGLIGQKLGMTSFFTPEGNYVPVTVIEAGPCVVTQIKTKETDGYNALQLGFGNKKRKRTTMPLQGHFKKSGGACYAFVREVAVDDPKAYHMGQSVSLDLFKVGEAVEVMGTSKGRGFAGVIKRHGFSGGRETHGSNCHRIPGSIGSCAWPAKVIKGKKLPGHYGCQRVTLKNLVIVDIRPEQNLIMVKGAIPGPAEGMVLIQKSKRAK